MKIRLIAILLVQAAGLGAVSAGVETTVHNLSITGPGDIKSDTEKEVCVFCHAAHVRSGSTPMWNREVPSTTPYNIYKSSTLKSAGRQPDGASKLCLSCHDGTIALGKVKNRPGGIVMRNAGPGGGIPGTRRANLGTDLSGAHPVSIVYDNALAARVNSASGREGGGETGLAARAAVPAGFLDKASKVQCTSCHETHDDSNYSAGKVPHFWRRPTVSEVCESCHTW